MNTADSAVEEWRAAPGFPDYSVSSLGRGIRRELPPARSHNTYVGKILKGHLGGPNAAKYIYVRPWRDGKGWTMRLSTLVALTFLGPRPTGAEVNHKDGNRVNNAVSNLEYVTKRQNWDHAVEHVLMRWGETHPQHKLTVAEVRQIRAQRGLVIRKELARRFKVSKSTIDSILSGATWRHLE